MDESRETLSLSEAAARLGMAKTTLRRAIDAGQLRAYRPGTRTIYISWTDILAWLESTRVEGGKGGR